MSSMLFSEYLLPVNPTESTITGLCISIGPVYLKFVTLMSVAKAAAVMAAIAINAIFRFILISCWRYCSAVCFIYGQNTLQR